MSGTSSTAKNFLERLTGDINSHENLRRFDSGLHQTLIIGSAIAGFASLSLGIIAKQGPDPDLGMWAGIVGGMTSVATILSQQLHCVKAINWHAKMAARLEAIRAKFRDKYKSAPNDDQLAALSEEVSTLKLEMQETWEKGMKP
jgi:hypothetical protein